MAALVLVEHDHHSLKAATHHAVSAAKQCSPNVDLLLIGSNAGSISQAAACIAGVRKVLYADAKHFTDQLPEVVAQQMISMAADYDFFLAPATAHGKSVMPRVAAKLDVAQISDITKVVSSDTYERPIYAGNAIATVQSSDPKKVITVRTTNFEAASEGGSAVIESIQAVDPYRASQFMGRELGSAEKYKELIEPLADKLGAALGASRAAVDAGYVPNDYQVGQTGKIVAPQLYIAVGISGAIQHLAGMKDSKIIVAINKDPDAPIFGVADYGLVGDLFTLIPELTAAL